MQVSGERYDEKPNKNRFSHIHDALQYMLLGAGEGRSLTIGSKSSKPFVAKRNFDVFTGKQKNIHDRYYHLNHLRLYFLHYFHQILFYLFSMEYHLMFENH